MPKYYPQNSTKTNKQNVFGNSWHQNTSPQAFITTILGRCNIYLAVKRTKWNSPSCWALVL